MHENVNESGNEIAPRSGRGGPARLAGVSFAAARVAPLRRTARTLAAPALHMCHTSTPFSRRTLHMCHTPAPSRPSD
eukprot:387558-Prorocentrum_minimum.AAC.1